MYPRTLALDPPSAFAVNAVSLGSRSSNKVVAAPRRRPAGSPRSGPGVGFSIVAVSGGCGYADSSALEREESAPDTPFLCPSPIAFPDRGESRVEAIVP